ncbi:hypothetical protein [Bradyrhizobium japonicum]|nr:hypothetical protein [Bradyrhizobium japonicum]
MRLIRLYVGRLCFKASLRIAIAGTVISGIEFGNQPLFPLYHF